MNKQMSQFISGLPKTFKCTCCGHELTLAPTERIYDYGWEQLGEANAWACPTCSTEE